MPLTPTHPDPFTDTDGPEIVVSGPDKLGMGADTQAAAA
jgi:hypothetical protein